MANVLGTIFNDLIGPITVSAGVSGVPTAGADTINGGAGADTMNGGAGNDTYIVDNVGDIVRETTDDTAGGIDLIEASVSYSLLPGTAGSQGFGIENLTLTGTAAINATGNAKANVLKGNSGANVLDGGAGVDTMNGGDGEDSYIVDNAADVVTENSDSAAGGSADTVRSSVSYILGSGAAAGQNGFGIENLSLIGSAAINATGNAKNNVLTGNSAGNVLDGGLGFDTMNGGDGNDSYIVNSSLDVVTENLDTTTGGAADTVLTSVSYTLGSGTLAGQNGFGIENLTLTGTTAINGTGNAKNNFLRGNNAINVLSGGLGTDTMNGGDASDTYIVDSFADVVTENFDTSIGGTADTVQSSVTYTLGGGSVAGANGFGIENLTLIGLAAINGTGNAKANVLTGNSANNLLKGEQGADTLNGGAGGDTMNGGDGDDTFLVDNTLDIVTENFDDSVGGTADTVQASVTYVLGSGTGAGQNGFGIENLTLTGSALIDGTGNAKANILKGNSAVNVLNGGAGVDTMNGGNGNDTYVVDSASDFVTEDVDTSTGGTADTVQALTTYTLGSGSAAGLNGFGIENLILSGILAINGTGNAKANVLTGNTAANRLNGEAGEDTLNGAAGADTMNGGDGNDTFIVDNAFDVVTENLNDTAGGVADTVQSSVTYTLGSGAAAGQNGFGIENLTLTGATAINGTGNGKDNVLTGNSASNLLSGGAGNDTLNGGAGIDTMNGGAGNDTYTVDSSSDLVSESANDLAAGIDLVRSSVSYSLQPASAAGTQGFGIENLTLTGNAAISATGNGKANTLTGNAAANRITGGAGNDSLIGDLGNDVFVIGEYGSGNQDQILDFSSGNDKIELTNSLDNGLAGALATGIKGLNFNGGFITGNPLLASWFFKGAGFTGAASGNASGIWVDTTTGNIFYNDENSAGSYIIANVAIATASTLTNLNFVYGA